MTMSLVIPLIPFFSPFASFPLLFLPSQLSLSRSPTTKHTGQESADKCAKFSNVDRFCTQRL